MNFVNENKRTGHLLVSTIVALTLFFPYIASAAAVSIDHDTPLAVEGFSTVLFLVAGSKIDTLVVDKNHYTLTVAAGESATVRWNGPNPGRFTNNGSLPDCNFVSGNNVFIVNGPKTVTVTPSIAVSCTATGSGGDGGGSGGSGGGGATPAAPAAAGGSDAYNPADATAASPDINTDKGLNDAVSPNPRYCVSGTLIKLPSDNDPLTQMDSAVYYCGKDGKRHVFPTVATYRSWYADFNQVVVLDSETMAKISLGQNITYRPGVKMIKIASDPKVYAVGKNGLLRFVTTEAVAIRLYGLNWNKMIDDVSEVFFLNYHSGETIS